MTLKDVKNQQLKMMQKHVKQEYQEHCLIKQVICGLLKMKMLVHGLNINLNLTIKLVEFNLKTEMMLKIKHQKFNLNLKISLNKLLI